MKYKVTKQKSKYNNGITIEGFITLDVFIKIQELLKNEGNGKYEVSKDFKKFKNVKENLRWKKN